LSQIKIISPPSAFFEARERAAAKRIENMAAQALKRIEPAG